jgi:GNAT superfamily N-acetyltransferase
VAPHSSALSAGGYPVGPLCWADVTALVIRRAGDADLAAIIELRREWTREQDGDQLDAGFDERLAAWFERESARRITWLAQAHGRAVGMMNLAIFERMPRPGHAPSHWGYLANAFILEAYRNQGTGTQLLSAVLRYADENMLARVVLSPSLRSVSFYERAGFGPADSLMLRTPHKRWQAKDHHHEPR